MSTSKSDTVSETITKLEAEAQIKLDRAELLRRASPESWFDDGDVIRWQSSDESKATHVAVKAGDLWFCNRQVGSITFHTLVTVYLMSATHVACCTQFNDFWLDDPETAQPPRRGASGPPAVHPFSGAPEDGDFGIVFNQARQAWQIWSLTGDRFVWEYHEDGAEWRPLDLGIGGNH